MFNKALVRKIYPSATLRRSATSYCSIWVEDPVKLATATIVHDNMVLFALGPTPKAAWHRAAENVHQILFDTLRI